MGGVSHGRLDFVKTGRGCQAVVGTLSRILAREGILPFTYEPLVSDSYAGERFL